MADLNGNVKVPVVGTVPKKTAAAGVAVTVVLIVVYYVRKKNSSASAAQQAATATDQYPPDGTTGNPQDPYSTDPATGQTYGDEAAGSGGTFGAFGSGAASGMYYDPATGAYDLTSPYGTSPVTQPYQTTGGPPFSSNSAWSDWVLQELQAQDPGIDAGALTTALGLYLNGQPVSPAQKTLVFDATAIAGDPPVAGPNGYPPKVQTNGGTGGGGTVIVPDVTGEDLVTAQRNMRYAGLKSTASGPRTTVPGEVRTVTGQSVPAGRQVTKGDTIALSYAIANPPAARVRVPGVVGTDLVTAQRDIGSAGLKSTASGPRTTRAGQVRTVTAQSPGAGAEADKGSTVRLTYKIT